MWIIHCWILTKNCQKQTCCTKAIEWCGLSTPECAFPYWCGIINTPPEEFNIFSTSFSRAKVVEASKSFAFGRPGKEMHGSGSNGWNFISFRMLKIKVASIQNVSTQIRMDAKRFDSRHIDLHWFNTYRFRWHIDMHPCNTYILYVWILNMNGSEFEMTRAILANQRTSLRISRNGNEYEIEPIIANIITY